MRSVLWELLLLWLCARARGDCRGECLSCERRLEGGGFDGLICLLECEGRAVPRATWELCAASSRPAPRPRRIPSPVWPPGDSTPSTHTSEDDLQADEDISRRPSAPPSSKEVQKRYGGFIGVRKSARKWNNQKRFSQFLRQYLGMAPRSTFRHRLQVRHRQN
ncbi:prepronociceptin isoform X1 [Taeniopygia guttata]|uniref:prepronociceptin isoform X1 n=1 Tax=Taeniopygia guttata TaxID=59729 RepID=UPI003BB8D414